MDWACDGGTLCLHLVILNRELAQGNGALQMILIKYTFLSLGLSKVCFTKN